MIQRDPGCQMIECGKEKPIGVGEDQSLRLLSAPHAELVPQGNYLRLAVKPRPEELRDWSAPLGLDIDQPAEFSYSPPLPAV